MSNPPVRPVFAPASFSDLPVSTRRGAPVGPLPSPDSARGRRSARPVPVDRILPSATTPTVVLFGFDRTTTKACELVAVRLGVVHVGVRDLWSACKAMSRAPRAMVLASSTVAPWDRAVVDQRAHEAQIHVRWIADHGVDQTAHELRTILLTALRPGRR